MLPLIGFVPTFEKKNYFDNRVEVAFPCNEKHNIQSQIYTTKSLKE
jgi:hypothetical protein